MKKKAWISLPEKEPKIGQLVHFVVNKKNHPHLKGYNVLTGRYAGFQFEAFEFNLPGIVISGTHWLPTLKTPDNEGS